MQGQNKVHLFLMSAGVIPASSLRCLGRPHHPLMSHCRTCVKSLVTSDGAPSGPALLALRLRGVGQNEHVRRPIWRHFQSDGWEKINPTRRDAAHKSMSFFMAVINNHPCSNPSPLTSPTPQSAHFPPPPCDMQLLLPIGSMIEGLLQSQPHENWNIAPPEHWRH